MEKIQSEFAQVIEQMGRHSGLDALGCQIYAIVYIEPEVISMDKVAELTKYSLASVSNKVRLLERVGLISRIRKPGTSKIFLQMDKDLISVMKNMLLKKEQNQIKIIKERLPIAIENSKGVAACGKEKKQVALMQNYYDQTMKLDAVLKEFRKKIERI